MPTPRSGHLSDLLTLPSDGAQPIIKGLLYEGQTAILVGSPGSGKSYFFLMLSVMAAAGGDWYGKFSSPRSMKVLYVATEGSVYDIQERIMAPARAMGWGDEAEENWEFWVPKYMDLTGQTAQGKLELDELCARAQAMDLIIFDSMYASFMGTASSDEIMGKVAQNVAILKDYGERQNKAVVFIHHDSRDKIGEDGSVIDRDKAYLGSVIIEAMADQMWHWTGRRADVGGAKFRQIKGRSRFHKLDSFFVTLDVESGVLMPQDMAPTIEAMKVESYFRMADGAMTTADYRAWAETEKIAWSTAKRHRKMLVDEGQVVQISTGVYKWVG